jgi:serine/threonine-protein kinase
MLVVLPFENLGRSEDEYFADGMTEEVTARLAGLHGLGVIGRTSAIQYKKTTKSIPQIGQELGVDYVLEGTVRWEQAPHGASRVRVTPQLVRVSDASHVWANVYDAVLADVFDVQSNIATQVAETLEVALLAPERHALVAKPTTNLEAYDYYLRGIDYDARNFVEEDARLAVRMYQRAVQLDSQFTLAYAGLARAHLMLAWVFNQTGEVPKARAALDRAQQLGRERAETRLALGYYYYWGNRDYDHALEQFAWVRERQPNDPDVISAISYIHRRQGRWVEAASELTRATELDPRNHGDFFDLGLTYGPHLRRYAEADRVLGRAISLAPEVPAYHCVRAYVYLMEDGDATRAKQVLRQAVGTIDPARILTAGHFYNALVRVFASDFGEALAHLPLRAVAGDTDGYYLAKAEYYGFTSDPRRAAAYFDSARVVLEAKVAARPRNKAAERWPVELPLALAYAGLGRKADALRLGREGAQLVPVARDAFDGPGQLLDLAEIYVRTGEYDAALDQLEYLLSIPSPVSSGLLRVDPLYAPLRGNPRFERLVREGK